MVISGRHVICSHNRGWHCQTIQLPTQQPVRASSWPVDIYLPGTVWGAHSSLSALSATLPSYQPVPQHSAESPTLRNATNHVFAQERNATQTLFRL